MSRNVLGNSAGAAAISPPTLGLNSKGTLAGDCLQAVHDSDNKKACFAIMLFDCHHALPSYFAIMLRYV